ncbi:MAG: long-chain fatty acid--CoA ligase [Acidobacteria bacterium]|nr:long-chain fatty acid--CoA ligase [Acidobacteriota bacterium]
MSKVEPIVRIPLYPNEPKTLGELFRNAAKTHNRADALNSKHDGEWRKISSDEMIARADRIALGLYSLGLRKDDKAAILAANSPDWTIADAGCQLSGVIDVPIYTTLAPNAVAYIIKDSGAKVFFVENKDAYERLRDIFQDCPSIEKIVFFNADGIDGENLMPLAELESLGEKLHDENPELIGELMSKVTADDIATLIYTSGTTGEPKGVMLTHSNLVSNVIDAGEKYNFTDKDVPLSVLPLSHVFERTGMYLYIFNGMAVHFAESLEKVADNLLEVRPTMFVGVPRLFEKVYAKAKLKAAQASPIKEKIFDWAIDVGKEYALCREKGESISTALWLKYSIADKIVFSKLREFFGGRLRFCITGGAALSDTIYLIFNGAGVAIMQGYGLTETSPVITSSNPANVKLGTVGKPIRNVQVRIARDGEIEARGPNVMLGYYNKPDATRDVFTEDGWFKTGDIGQFDDDGFLRITDRKKELFKTSGGKYIAPSPIEQMIKGSRFVSQVVLVGNERKFPAALIVPSFDQLASFAKEHGLDLDKPDEVCAHERVIQFFEREVNEYTQELSNYERVKRIALLHKELTVEGGELTPTLKIKRRVVNERYATIIEQIYEEN